MAAEYFDATGEIKEIASRLIEDHHSHLAEAKIGYFLRTGTWERNKRAVFGTAQKPSGLLKAITGLNFIITLNGQFWHALGPETKEALLDHELQHCCKDEDEDGYPIWYIQGHDFEDFTSIIRRHGLWTDELRKIPSATQEYKQTTIPGLTVVK